MQVEQFVMAYGVEQDRLRALLPQGFSSLRPVLRINAEIRGGREAYLELNTAVETPEVRGWLNLGHWTGEDGLTFRREGKSVTFSAPFLTITFTGVGLEGGCPAEGDNGGCYFPGKDPALRLPEPISVNKEFCDCTFAWSFAPGDAHGVSTRETLPAIPTAQQVVYPKVACTPENAAAIPCQKVLGCYQVVFQRE